MIFNNESVLLQLGFPTPSGKCLTGSKKRHIDILHQPDTWKTGSHVPQCCAKMNVDEQFPQPQLMINDDPDSPCLHFNRVSFLGNVKENGKIRGKLFHSPPSRTEIEIECRQSIHP